MGPYWTPSQKKVKHLSLHENLAKTENKIPIFQVLYLYCLHSHPGSSCLCCISSGMGYIMPHKPHIVPICVAFVKQRFEIWMDMFDRNVTILCCTRMSTTAHPYIWSILLLLWAVNGFLDQTLTMDVSYWRWCSNSVFLCRKGTVFWADLGFTIFLLK